MDKTLYSPSNYLDLAADGVGVTSAYQPIVELSDRQVIGYEALARWPELDYPSPPAVFAHAAARGGLDRLDHRCIGAAVEGALNDDLDAGTMLFVNCEANSAYVGVDDDDVLARGRDQLTLAFEFTERSLLDHPRALLRKVAAVRADGFAVALDDVGANPDSLALLDVVCPDVVKLDLALVQSDPTHDQARTLSALMAHQERTGAVIVAEGIETEAHLDKALALGASLGQGYLFGRVDGLNEHGRAVPWSIPKSGNVIEVESRSPFELVSPRCQVRTATRHTVRALSRHIENQALHAADPPMLMAGLQHVENFTPAMKERYRELAARLPLVAVFGEELPADLGAGVRKAPLAATDPLCLEWTVLMLGPHAAAVLTAREHDGQRHGGIACEERRFDVVISHDRGLVTECARGLLDRIP